MPNLTRLLLAAAETIAAACEPAAGGVPHPATGTGSALPPALLVDVADAVQGPLLALAVASGSTATVDALAAFCMRALGNAVRLDSDTGAR
jgi:hypothetical protein